jgi:tRNA (mo5U34)-methyltransferase
MRVDDGALRQRVNELGPWFHNLRLSGVETAPGHFLGDFPSNFWRYFEHAVPRDLTGKSVLDIGCNAGFYSFELKRRGAARVLGVDHDPAYLRQAQLAREVLGLDVEFRQLDAYSVDTLGEQFDVVLFLGVFYHLRHPLLALERVAALTRELLIFQTMERGSDRVAEVSDDAPISDRDMFLDEGFPRLHFIEHRYAGDATNWWVPNPAASLAMLRSVGMRVVERPCQEVYVCTPAAVS